MDVDAEVESINTHSMKCELNTLSRADGSCILCEDDSVMAAAVYGPVEVKHHKMQIDKTSVEVIYKPKYGQSQLADRLYESFIGKICETSLITSCYPRTAIYVIIQEMQNSGTALACCINAVCLALIHSGIAMNYLFAAVTSPVHCTDPGELNPSNDDMDSSITFVFENTCENVLAIDSKGKITDDEYKRCLQKCKESSRAIFGFYKDIIRKYATKL